MPESLIEGHLAVGEMIKKLRQGAGLSLEELARRSGIQPTDLEEIENNMISPALGILTRICGGLGVGLGYFFQHGPRKQVALVRESDAKAGTRFASKDGADHGYEYISLGSEKRSRVMEPFLVIMDPASDASGKLGKIEEKLGTHNGEEFLYVLEGEIQVDLDEQSFVLERGDSIYYDATTPHRVLHRGQRQSKVLAVIHIPREV